MFAIAGNLVNIPVSSSPLPMKYPAATFPTTFTCPLTLTFPFDIRTSPMFPEIAVTFPTSAYSPVTFPLMSMLAIVGRMIGIPFSSAPFPTKYPAVTFPTTFTCPLTLTFPFDIRTSPMFPEIAVTFPTSTYSPVTFPLMSMLAIVGKLIGIPFSSAPFPTKYPAVTFPTTFTCPLTLTFPPAILTLPMFPALALTFPTLAYAPVRLPLMSMFAFDGNLGSIPVSNAPLPVKYSAATFPRTST